MVSANSAVLRDFAVRAVPCGGEGLHFASADFAVHGVPAAHGALWAEPVLAAAVRQRKVPAADTWACRMQAAQVRTWAEPAAASADKPVLQAAASCSAAECWQQMRRSDTAVSAALPQGRQKDPDSPAEDTAVRHILQRDQPWADFAAYRSRTGPWADMPSERVHRRHRRGAPSGIVQKAGI